MTPEQRIAEIEARAAKATPGPWVNNDGGIRTATPNFPSHLDEEVRTGDICDMRCHDRLGRTYQWDEEDKATGDFIARARVDVPWLLEQLKAATEYDKLADAVWAALQKGAWLHRKSGITATASECRALATIAAALQAAVEGK